MKDSEIIYGSQLKDLSIDDLLTYFEKLIKAIERGWKYEGRYILKDYTKYEIQNRIK
jgi:hypothetical protein